MVRFNNNDYVQDYAREQALIESDRETDIEEAQREGIIIGRKEGEKSKTIEIAKKMLKNNKDIEEIILFTDLTKDEIEALREKL